MFVLRRRLCLSPLIGHRRRLAHVTSPPPRGDYSEVTSDDVAYFQSVLGKEGVVTLEEQPEVLQAANTDWLGSYKGRSGVLLQPHSTRQVSLVLAKCHERRLAVCPQGGNTGLVGGSVPVYDELILSMRRMNRVLRVDEVSGVATCEGGCVLQTLDDALAQHNLTIPLDLGARGTCHVGGNVSTNAGGLRFARYGSLHGNVLGLEVVLCDGTILDMMSVLRKDNTGYDLKQLFIGSEGTLGVVTRVVIQCPKKPSSVHLAFIGCRSFEDVLRVFRLARSHLGEVLSAFEMMDSTSLELVRRHFGCPPALEQRAMPQRSPFYALVETSGSRQTHDREKMEDFLQEALQEPEAAAATSGGGGGVACAVVGDGWGSSAQQMQSLWAVRENVTGSTLRETRSVLKYDVSLPLPHLYSPVLLLRGATPLHSALDSETRAWLGRHVHLCLGFGHVGDGNVHVNVCLKDDVVEEGGTGAGGGGGGGGAATCPLDRVLFEHVTSLGGSISAEHGIGRQKLEYLKMGKSEEVMGAMRKLKTHFDPKGILNPYKLIMPN